MKFWIESLSIKNFVIAVLAGIALFEMWLIVYMSNSLGSKIERQEIRMIPAVMSGTTEIPYRAQRERILAMLSGYLVLHSENVDPISIQSFAAPMLTMAAPESYTNLRSYFGHLAKFVKDRSLVIETQIDPSSEQFNLAKGEYKALGVTTIRSSVTGKPLASELREYYLKWKLKGSYAGVLSYKYKVLQSSLPERRQEGNS